MTTTSTALRHRAAIVAWALRRSASLPWRQCVTAGLAVASMTATPNEDKIEEALSRLVRAGEIDRSAVSVTYTIAHAWRQRRAEDRAVASSCVEVSEYALVELAASGKATTWESIARLEARPRRREARTVLVRRHQWEADVEAVAPRRVDRKDCPFCGSLYGRFGTCDCTGGAVAFESEVA